MVFLPALDRSFFKFSYPFCAFIPLTRHGQHSPDWSSYLQSTPQPLIIPTRIEINNSSNCSFESLSSRSDFSIAQTIEAGLRPVTLWILIPGEVEYHKILIEVEWDSHDKRALQSFFLSFLFDPHAPSCAICLRLHTLRIISPPPRLR